jgi:hypothetical protein
VIDLETTGLDLRHDEIVSFGAVIIKGARILCETVAHGHVRPAREISTASVKVHGLRASDLLDAPPINGSEAGPAAKMCIGAGISPRVGCDPDIRGGLDTAGLDLHAFGRILMAAGTIGLILYFYFWNRRRASRPVAQQPQTRANPPAVPRPHANGTAGARRGL